MGRGAERRRKRNPGSLFPGRVREGKRGLAKCPRKPEIVTELHNAGRKATQASTMHERYEPMDQNPDLRDVRPSSLAHIVGQRHVTQALQIAIDASFQEHKRLDEILLCGPPGLGKTAYACLLADELAVPFIEVLAQSITNAAELNTVLLSASEGILFLDEIHLLHPVQQHAPLQVIDKQRIFLSGGKSVQSVPVAPFTLVGDFGPGRSDPALLDQFENDPAPGLLQQR